MNALDQAFFEAHPHRRYRIRLATNTEIVECRKAGAIFPAANLPDQFIHSLISRAGITVCVVVPLRGGEALKEQSKLLWTAGFELALGNRRRAV
jgi:hypothetical protein